MANKVTYGLSNVVVFPITEVDEKGKPTYGTQIKMPGATELTTDPQGSSNPFYGDNNIYYQSVSNTGYTGTLKVADIPVEFLQKCMGETADKDGALIENAETKPNEFAMAFEFEGDSSKRRHIFYRCIATRPSVGSSTKTDSIEPNTAELAFTAMPRLDNSNVKARCEKEDACYASWYTAPHEVVTETASTIK